MIKLHKNEMCRHFSGYKPCTLSTNCDPDCKSLKIGEPRLLVIALGAMGSVLRSTVVLLPLKRRWPNAHITWITAPMCRGLLENNPYIDRLFTTDNAGVLSLKALAFDYAFCLDKSLEAAGILCVPISIGACFGFGADPKTGAIRPLNEEAQELYKIGLSNEKKFFENKKPETQLITEALGLTFQRDPYVYQFTGEEKAEAECRKEDLNLKGVYPIIGFNTGCSDFIRYRKFSVNGWIELGNLLLRKFSRATILLLGGPGDTARNSEIHAGLKSKRVRQTYTEEGVRQGMIEMSLCDAVVTGDSLGLHMAIALSKKTVAWFGPTCPHEIDFYENGNAVLAQVKCSPCWKRSCEKSKMCYDSVDYNELALSLEKLLSGKGSSDLNNELDLTSQFR